MKQNVVSKTFTLLRAFTDKRYEWGVNELARYLEMPVSTVHRLLSLLKEEGVLEYSEKTLKYRIGSDFIRMASIISSQIDVKKYARSFLVELSRNLKHSVYFALYFPQERKLSFVESLKSSHALQFVLEIGTLEPIHVASSGKSILAYLSEEEKIAVLAENVDSESERNKILKELKKIKDQGFAITANERKKGAQSISAPVFDASGKVIGSIICVMPVSDYEHEKEPYYISCVKKAAGDLSYSLGFKKL